MIIRPIIASDEMAWRSLWQGYCEFYDQGLDEEVTCHLWQALLDLEHSPYGRVLEQGGQLVGFSHYVLHPTTWTLTEACYLEDLYVAPTHRGQRLGKALIDDLLVLCRANDWARLYWHTRTGNLAARRLYDHYIAADDFVRYRMAVD